MTDKELLENAAKAAGIAAEWHHWPSTARGCMYVKNGLFSEADGEGYSVWNPLTDDGDALRLAVKLQMSLDTALGQSLAISLGGKDCVERHADDPLAATRRAIVRAAAEIGRLA